MIRNRIKIIIEGNPVSINATYKTGTGRNKRKMYLSERAQSYGDIVGWQVKAQYRKPPLTGMLEVLYLYYFKNESTRDHLNFNKLLNDRCNQILWQDDKQIKVSHHYTLVDKTNPRVELFVRSIDKIEPPASVMI